MLNYIFATIKVKELEGVCFMQNIYLGRQPILDSSARLVAYEILYKGSEAALSRYSSASIINNVLNKFGTHTLLGDRRGFVKIDEKFLLHDIIFSIPSKFFIFSILSSVPLSERVVERMEHLYEKGYKLSIDNIEVDENTFAKYKSILKYLSFVKVDTKGENLSEIAAFIQSAKEHNIVVVADNIESDAEYKVAKKLGCDWFQGYFFAEPKILENAKYEPSNMAVLRLYNLLMQDVNIDEITQEFENNHEITVQLLQFINSGAFHFRNRISSIHHVLTLVGRIPLGQWLMLMIYSKSVTKDEKTPLMLMVKNRTELMENILKVVEPDARSNRLGEAYFVGVLSLIDTIFSAKLEDILEQMNISESVEAALLRDEGLYGEIYALVRDIEAFNTDAIYNFEKRHKLAPASIEKIALESMRSVNSFEKPETVA